MTNYKRYKTVADFLYKGVVDWFLDQMSEGAIAPGDKMPSLRALSKQLGLSLNTVIHGYEILTEEGWIESRPKSGYFVCHRSETKPALLLAGEALVTLDGDGAKSAWSCLAHRAALVDQSDAFLSPPARQEEVELPVLGKGHLTARESVSDYLKGLGVKSHASQLWLGRSPLAMFTQSVQTLTKRGDTALVLTPCDPRLTTTLLSLGRRVIAIAAGDRGVDLDLVIRCLRDETISLIVLPGQFSFPTGTVVSNLSLRRWLAIIEETKLPTIEWDLCSHLAHRAGPVMTYKSLDQSDHIVYIGGVESKGVDRSASWCIPGRHQALLEGAFLGADMAMSDAQQVSLIDALQPTSKRSLTKRSRQVWANTERVKAHLEARLGDKVSFAASKGGLSLWMHLSIPLETADITALLASYRHAIVPGTLVSHEPDANHWLAVNVTLDDIEALANSLAERLKIYHVEEQPTQEIQQVAEEVLTTEESITKEDIGKVQEDAKVEKESIDEPESPVKDEFPELESEAAKTSESETKKEEDKQRDASSDPLYNPMLDLINHDFG